MANATKNGDQVADETIPLIDASATIFLYFRSLSEGIAAAKIANTPVLIIPPKIWAVI